MPFAVANGPYSVKVTFPGAMPPLGKNPLLIVAVSVNDAPLPMTSAVGDGVVAMVGWTFCTTSGSEEQTLVAPELRPPPEYTACHQKLPGRVKVSVADGGIVPSPA